MSRRKKQGIAELRMQQALMDETHKTDYRVAGMFGGLMFGKLLNKKLQAKKVEECIRISAIRMVIINFTGSSLVNHTRFAKPSDCETFLLYT